MHMNTKIFLSPIIITAGQNPQPNKQDRLFILRYEINSTTLNTVILKFNMIRKF